MREIRYKAIADDLRRRLDAGELAPGRLLPSEAELSASYAASRVTVRKALEELRNEGRVDSRQGFGWFVRSEPVRQTLARLGTIEAQLEASGVRSERRILSFGFVPAPPRAEEVLGADTVLEVRRLNLADDEPFALVTVWCPEDLAGSLSRDAVERSPFYELLDVPLGGAVQTIGAAVASPEVAELLHVPVGAAVLEVERVTSTPAGRPVLCSEHVFPAHRTHFVVDLPVAEPSMSVSGLRLVE